jgi:glycosyltransferase involved in cell wall biosynthesis
MIGGSVTLIQELLQEVFMINGKKLIVVMPAYNAEQTLVKTYEELPHDIVDEVILVDDFSRDHTIEVARRLGIATIIRHNKNLGYGGNQKTCYTAALKQGADIVVMVHPDYQYSPKLCGAISWMIASGEYDMVLASRILGRGALKGGMPIWKYIANRFLTAFENTFIDVKLSEYHTGYRAFTREVLEALPLHENSDDFVFDNQMIAQAVAFGFNLGEISCPTRYMPEASSINFRRSVKYGFGVLGTSIAYRLHKWGIVKSLVYAPNGRKLETDQLADRGQVVAKESASELAVTSK